MTDPKFTLNHRLPDNLATYNVADIAPSIDNDARTITVVDGKNGSSKCDSKVTKLAEGIISVEVCAWASRAKHPTRTTHYLLRGDDGLWSKVTATHTAVKAVAGGTRKATLKRLATTEWEATYKRVLDEHPEVRQMGGLAMHHKRMSIAVVTTPHHITANDWMVATDQSTHGLFRALEKAYLNGNID